MQERYVMYGMVLPLASDTLHYNVRLSQAGNFTIQIEFKNTAVLICGCISLNIHSSSKHKFKAAIYR